MSQWTHVTGSMSVDVVGGIPLFKNEPGNSPAVILQRLTGTWTNSWHRDAEEYWPDALENRAAYGQGPGLPSGSEGPMHYFVHNMGSRSSMNNGLVVFWGNLRDYGLDEVKKEMIPYFEDLLRRYDEAGVFIRNMAIEIEPEGEGRMLLTTSSIPKPGGGEFDTITVLKVIEVVE